MPVESRTTAIRIIIAGPTAPKGPWAYIGCITALADPAIYLPYGSWQGWRGFQSGSHGSTHCGIVGPFDLWKGRRSILQEPKGETLIGIIDSARINDKTLQCFFPRCDDLCVHLGKANTRFHPTESPRICAWIIEARIGCAQTNISDGS